ncbi:MAG: nucleoside 2-deoxyribosyltransferase [Candidatus Nitrosopolaris sp.]
MENDKFIVYLASPYGFTDAGREFMKNTMIPGIKQVVSLILNPWDSFDTVSLEFEKINSLNDIRKQKDLLRDLNKKIGLENENSLKRAQIIIAILDGSDVDSGVASEIGYSYALKKKIISYRSDLRLTGDNQAAGVNLQVEYFIGESGGCIVMTVPQLKQVLEGSQNSS